MGRKFCRSTHSLTLKMINYCFEYIEWCFQIFKEFVDIFLENQSQSFSVKVMICLASFDACLLGVQKRQEVTNKSNKEKV